MFSATDKRASILPKYAISFQISRVAATHQCVSFCAVMDWSKLIILQVLIGTCVANSFFAFLYEPDERGKIKIMMQLNGFAKLHVIF
jgi:hypothetical protein